MREKEIGLEKREYSNNKKSTYKSWSSKDKIKAIKNGKVVILNLNKRERDIYIYDKSC